MASIAEIQYAVEQERSAKAAEIQYAVEQARQAERKEMVRRVIARHIGEPPAEVAAKLDALTPNQVDRLSDALFDLHSYADVETWLGRLA